MIVQTERLYLREVTEGDFAFLFRLFSDPEVMKYYGSVRDEKQTRAWMEYSFQNYRKHGFGKGLVVRREDERPLGHCGFVRLLVDDVEEPELGYFLAREEWGKGYATEAAGAMLHHGFESLGFERVISTINPCNESSIRVATRLGMSREKSNATARAGDVVWTCDVYSTRSGAFSS